jgi:hypothetical protein
VSWKFSSRSTFGALRGKSYEHSPHDALVAAITLTPGNSLGHWLSRRVVEAAEGWTDGQQQAPSKTEAQKALGSEGGRKWQISQSPVCGGAADLLLDFLGRFVVHHLDVDAAIGEQDYFFHELRMAELQRLHNPMNAGVWLSEAV